MEYIKTKCDFCGKEIEKSIRYFNQCKKHFCNRDCMGKFISSQKSVTIEKCNHCGKEIKRTRNQRRNSKTGLYFCNNICKNIYIAQKSRWHKNPYDHRGRINRVYEAANFSCQKCGYNEDKRMLDIHHNDGDNHNNEWENLRCICTWCHTKHHRKVEIIKDLPKLNFRG